MIIDFLNMEKRLFIGIKIYPSSELLDFYSRLKSRLENEKISWVDIENMHITLKYLGNTDINLISQISESLVSIAKKNEPFRIEIKGFGRFKKNRKTNVIWLGVGENRMLNKLASDVIGEMSNFGFEPENRPYRAHLTLGRVKSNLEETILEGFEEKYKDFFLQDLIVENLILYESLRINGLLLYKPLNTYQLD